MQPKRDFDQVWKDLASLLKSLTPEEQRRFQVNFGFFAHDMRQALGIIYSAEGLLRRKKNIPPDELELLEMIRGASKRAMGLLTEFAQPFDGQATLPLSRTSDNPDK
jgi:hypothetical protein